MLRRYLLILCLAIPVFAADQPIARESGNLTNTEYKNPFYQLELTLPKANKVTRRTMAALPRGVHALLALKFENVDSDGALTVFATDASSGLPLDPRQAALRQAEDCKAAGMSFRAGPSEMVNSRRTHQNIPYQVPTYVLEEYNTPTREAMVYQFFQRKGELITVVGAMRQKTASGSTLTRQAEMRQGRSEVSLDPSSGDFGTHTLTHAEQLGTTSSLSWWILPEYSDAKGPIAINYEGPAPKPSESAVDAAPVSPVALPTDARISGNLFSSAALGLRYGFPQGWKLVAEGQDPFAQYHPEPRDAAARASHDLLRSCSRTVLQLVDAGPNASSEPATLSLLVADPACLHLQLPDMSKVDQLSAFASTLAQYSDFGTVSNAGLLNDSGRSFVELQGKINDKNGKPARAQVAFVTPHNNFLLLFFFTANDSSQIDIFPNAGLSFDPEKK